MVTSRWQCVEDLISLGFESHTSCSSSKHLTTGICAMAIYGAIYGRTHINID